MTSIPLEKTHERVLPQIRAMYESTATIREISATFGVTTQTIRDVADRNGWERPPLETDSVSRMIKANRAITLGGIKAAVDEMLRADFDGDDIPEQHRFEVVCYVTITGLDVHPDTLAQFLRSTPSRVAAAASAYRADRRAGEAKRVLRESMAIARREAAKCAS